MRDIQVSKRGSEAASEEPSDKWRKTERFEREALNTSASSDHMKLRNVLRVGRPSRPGSVLVQKSGPVDDDVQLSALDAVYEKDGRCVRVVSRRGCRRSQEK